VQAAQVTPTPSPTATVPRATVTPTTTATPPAEETVAPTLTPTPRTHIVEAGQSLYNIAQQYQVSVDELVALNSIADERSLQVGQVLIVPDSPINWDTPDNEQPPLIVHVIQAGETLSGLAYEYDTPIDAIVAANPDVNLDLIYEGQEIIIPLALPTPTPTFTPPPTPTATATSLYTLPALLTPAEGEIVSGPVLLFNWTATGWLANDEFYVLQLTWPDGSTSAYWTKSNSWRVMAEDHPPAGMVTWQVDIRRQTGITPGGTPVGERLTTADEVRLVEWVETN